MNKLSCKVLFFFSLMLPSCFSNVDFKYPRQISLSIAEAKEKNVFLKSYSIENIKLLSHDAIFPIKEVWLEKGWGLTLDSSGRRIVEIDSNSHHLVFGLYPNAYLNNDNYLDNWIIYDKDSSSTGSMRGMVHIIVGDKFIADSSLFTVYKLTSPSDSKRNLSPLANFILVAQ